MTRVTTSLVPPTRLAAVAAGAGCADCHLPDHDTFRDERLVLTAEDHACSGFPLDAPHDRADCAACHGDPERPFAERYPGRRADDCAACHDDPHGGQFATGPFAEDGCLACHDRTAFAPHAFGSEEHARAFLPLDGAHAEQDCETCHEVPRRDAPRVFRGTPNRCEDCHADAHDGFFDAVAAGLPRKRAGECSRCHGTTTFSELPEPFPHLAWTGFALDGSHRQADCGVCHPRAAEPDDTSRTFGRVTESFGAVEGCADCHRDPHEGAFDSPGMPARVDGAAGCARCHGTTSFRALADDFDHRLWTGFPLNGAHASTRCDVCHTPLRRPDEVGRTWGRAAGSDCAACHVDHHAQQFAVDGVTDCAACHRDGDAFSELRFSHEQDSRFPLGEAHRDLACAECHEPEWAGGAQVVRYKPLPTECVDCHGVHESVLLRRAGISR